MSADITAIESRTASLLLSFRLKTAAESLVSRLVQADQGDALETILEVLEMEQEARQERRVTRLRRASRLPTTKTFETFDDKPLTRTVVRKLKVLQSGDFLESAINVLAFGLPGVGKSHAIAALGHALVCKGKSVLWTPTYTVVQELLAAKRDLDLPRKLRKLDQYDLLILDDIGYIKQSSEDAEVLFTLLAERYERRSTAITSNLVFSEWDRIFKNKMATSAAIDRLVHHSTILEFDVTSYRTEKAKKRKKQAA
jgi:DNA replication protein DnaC